jgi:hypothetical protein
MKDRSVQALLGVIALLLVLNLARPSMPSVEAQPIGNVARLPAHGNCVGIIAEGGIVFRAFAEMAPETKRLYC